MKKLFLDVETTGTNVKIHSIWQIAGYIEIDDNIIEKFNYLVKPNPKCQYDEIAMRVGKVTKEQIENFPDMKIIHKTFTTLLGKYIDRFDQKDKFHIVGFNNRSFDDVFIRAWFEQNGDVFFGSWFFSDSLDTLVLASEYLLERRINMANFKLKTVAKELGIVVDPDRLHDAEYDISLTRQIYRIVTGREIEI